MWEPFSVSGTSQVLPQFFGAQLIRLRSLQSAFPELIKSLGLSLKEKYPQFEQSIPATATGESPNQAREEGAGLFDPPAARLHS